MKGKKVCHIISGYQRNDPRIFQRMCKSLKQFGYNVCILTNDGLKNDCIDGIEIYDCEKHYVSRLMVLLFATWQFLPKSKSIDADVYHIHSPELIFLGYKLKQKGKKVIYDAHEDLPRHILEKDWLPRFIRKPLSWLTEAYMNLMLKRYDAITSPHEHVVNYLNSHNPRSILLTNFAKVNTEFKTFTFEEYLARPVSICYSGTVYLHSNQAHILDAISDFKDVTYNIAGFIPAQLLKIMKQHVSYKKINYIGRIPWEDLIDFYSSSRIGMVIIDYKMNLGNIYGTFAVNKMFEYMEAGLPIICSDYVLWKQVIDKHKCGIYVKPGSTNQIREAIYFLVQNPELAYRMGKNGRHAVLNEYNWSTQEVKYISLLEDVLF